MAFNPADATYGVPGSTLENWKGLYSPSNPNITTWYNPEKGVYVDYNSLTNNATRIANGGAATSGNQTRLQQVQSTFASDIRNSQNNLRLGGSANGATIPTTGALVDAVATAKSVAQTKGNKPRDSYPTAYYPQSLTTTRQDRIKFTMRESGIRSTKNVGGGLQAFTPRTSGTALGQVFLAIPNQISDSNSADWSSATMNPLQMQMASLALSGMQNPSTNVADMLTKLGGDAMKKLKEFAASSPNRAALQLYLAQEAAGAQGLLSRTAGIVANPNVELLFNGPSLRPFTFNFRMTPRDQSEAKNVKQIIRFFKEGMAVQTTDQDVFLKSPNVFDLQFQSGSDNQPHTSLPKIKTCALIGCDVDYTPDGSYMTLDDKGLGYPMTCYQMTLRFNEIEPVYARDYSGLDENDIGY